jgi:hypothetical protein
MFFRETYQKYSTRSRTTSGSFSVKEMSPSLPSYAHFPQFQDFWSISSICAYPPPPLLDDVGKEWRARTKDALVDKMALSIFCVYDEVCVVSRVVQANFISI